jgi:hypothetical protein
MSCKDNYIWTGSGYSSTQDSANSYILYLGGGRTICDIINSNHTRLPEHIKLYEGGDYEVPANIRCNDRDLVIRCNELASIQDVTVCYYDSLANIWRGPYNPEDSCTDATKEWFVFKDFLDMVIPFRSEIRLQLSGDLEPIKPVEPVNTNAATSIQLVQPPEEFRIGLELYIYNDAAMTDLNTVINTSKPSEDFPVMLYTGTEFCNYPEDGATKETAGQYVVVSLKNLKYSDIVFIKWIWRGLESDAVAGRGASSYPAYTATNPDNIGFVWETNM